MDAGQKYDVKYAALMEALDEQEKNKAMAKQRIQDELLSTLENKPNAVDLSPTAAFLDSIYGTKLSPAFQGAGREDELADKKATELTGALAGIESDASDEKIAALKQGIMGDQLAKQAGQQGRFDDSQERNFEKEIQADYDKDILDPAADKLKQYADIDAALNTNDYRTATAMLPQIARGLGQTGVLTDRDIGLVFPKSIATKVADFEAYATGKAKIPEGLGKYMKDLVARGKKNLADQIASKAAAKQALYEKRSAAQTYGTYKPGKFGYQTNETVKSITERLAAPASAQSDARAKLEALRAAKAARGK